MKKLMVMCLMMCFMISACGTNAGTDEVGKDTEISENTNQNVENNVQDDAQDSEADVQNDAQESETDIQNNENEVVDGEVPYELRDMLPVMDGFMMYAVEQQFVFDAADPEVFWGIMFYTVGNYAGNSQFSEIDGDYLRVNRMFVQEYATGQFAEYGDLPEVPEKWSEDIIYDEGWDAYKFALGDRGVSAAEIVSWQPQEDGIVDVTARLFDLTDNSTILKVKFRLVENKYADGITYPMFLYAIEAVENVTE